MNRMYRNIVLSVILASAFIECRGAENRKKDPVDSPRIINIINFIRQTDYRLENSDALMFETVEKQIDLVNKYDFPATFLFQYDALINPEYQELMKTRLGPKCEIGAWWEITQPHVEAAGIVWRGEHPWVSTAHVAFTPGYTKQEREKLVDVYMAKFKDIYGEYPRSVGSWFIDSHSLLYMYEKYGIVASCNCRDQVGTDGYTLWGGYWNQAYYPSRKNAYMPAQTDEEQIPVPIFRMLGSDPIYQYEMNLGTGHQGVVTLEPVYRDGGGSKKWVEYFFGAIVDEPCLAFNYAQAGQENSFTWGPMGKALEMQFPIIASMHEEGRIRLETLSRSGMWFRERFPTTPATAVTAMKDVRNEGNRTVWYNSRFYRVSLLWERDGFCIRDIHMFDEDFQSEYFDTPGTGGKFFYYTLPVIDRFHWSTPGEKTGLRLVKFDRGGNKTVAVLSDPIVTEPAEAVLKIESKDEQGNVFVFTFSEGKIEVSSGTRGLDWALELKVPGERIDRLPFDESGDTWVGARFHGFDYRIVCEKGSVLKGDGADYSLRFVPARNKLAIDCTNDRNNLR